MNAQTIVQDEKYLTFYMQGQLLALPSENVNEIIRPQHATVVPGLPSYITGIINLRGKILPLIDLNRKLGQDNSHRNQSDAGVIVVSWDNCTAGLIVDAVKNVSSLSSNEAIDSPPRLSNGYAAYASGITRFEGETAVILDLAKLLDE